MEFNGVSHQYNVSGICNNENQTPLKLYDGAWCMSLCILSTVGQ